VVLSGKCYYFPPRSLSLGGCSILVDVSSGKHARYEIKIARS